MVVKLDLLCLCQVPFCLNKMSVIIVNAEPTREHTT